MAAVSRHGAAALRDGKGRLLGTIEATESFVRNARGEALALYGTDDAAHPGAAYLLARPSGLIGGPVTVLPAPTVQGHLRPCVPRGDASLDDPAWPEMVDALVKPLRTEAPWHRLA